MSVLGKDYFSPSSMQPLCILLWIYYIVKFTCLLAGSNQDSLPDDQQPNVVNCASCQQLVLESNALHKLPALEKHGWFCDKCEQQPTLRGAILLVRDASNASALATSMVLMILPGHITVSLPSCSQNKLYDLAIFQHSSCSCKVCLAIAQIGLL